MASKLTLTIKGSTIEKAKLHAKNTGRSLSKLIENYLEMLTDENTSKSDLSPKLKKIVGVVKLPKDLMRRRCLLMIYSIINRSQVQ